MGWFSRLLGAAILISFALALSAQQPLDPTPVKGDTPRYVERVPPPAEDALPAELENQGDLLRAQKHYLDSIDYYRAASKKANTAVLHNKTGISLMLLRRDSEARKEFQQSIHMDKQYSEAYNNLGALYYNMHRWGSAIKEYKKAIDLNQASASFHSNLGTAYFAQRDFDRAVKEYQRAMELDPEIFDRSPSGGVSIKLITTNDLGHFYYVMAQMYGQRGDAEHCRYYLSKANEGGYPIRDALRDNVFADLRKDPNFVAFVRALKPASNQPE
jgi:tetratricopeptide (TPR) repeat protein